MRDGERYRRQILALGVSGDENDTGGLFILPSKN
jgi:hypothetical protein